MTPTATPKRRPVGARGAIGIVLVMIASLLMTAVPAAGQAGGSIVYSLDNNIWIAAPDGSQARQLTTDGTEAQPYTSPTSSADGRIWAVRREPYIDSDGRTHSRGIIHQLDRQGRQLAEPFAPGQSEAGDTYVQTALGISDLAVSPDGEVLVYEDFYISTNCSSTPCFVGDPAWYLLAVAADGSAQVAAPSWVFHSDPQWLDNTTVLTTDRWNGVHTARLGDADATPWWDHDVQVFGASLGGGTLAVVVAGYDPDTDEQRNELAVYASTGPPQQPSYRCSIPQPDVVFDTPTISSSGAAMWWSESDTSADYAPNIYTTQLSPGGCGTRQLLVPGGRDPEWSSASVDGGGGPPVTPPPSDEDGILPPGVVRLDGGGAEDPIGQAITMSQVLFADGEADRVLLATSDRFPDALAGAALAGPFGPILFTPTGQPLDGRVAAEISRVTGGNAVVLTLGGVAAVSEDAAGAARAAGGNVACAAPMPSSCRFAGSGREETAALIAEVVAAEAPQNAGIAMVARGDDFADAITGGAFAAATGIPILLTPTTLAHPFTVEWLQRHGVTDLIVLGGTAAVSDATVAGLPGDAFRVSGAERTATSVAIAEQLWGQIDLPDSGAVVVNVRHADGWQTALSAAVLSARAGMPQLGVETPPQGLSASVQGYLAGRGETYDLLGVGGQSLVSGAQLHEAGAARG